MARCELVRAVLDDRSLATLLLAMCSQGALRALGETCRRWARDARLLAPAYLRLLAQLTSWPAALCGCEQPGLRLRARARLVESIRMGCQDPQASATGGDVALPQGTRPRLSAGDAGDWFRDAVFRDRGTSDRELSLALGHAQPGDVRKLMVCSDRLTDAGVLGALGPHWAILEELCISNSGPAGGRVTGKALEPMLRAVRPQLQSLVLIDVPDLPAADIAGKCDLKTLMIRGRMRASCIEAISHCRGLEVLKLSLEMKVVQDPFIRVFTLCRQLRVVDIYGATDVSDQILGCLMLHVANLEDFRGSHAGDHLSCSHVLSVPMTTAFRAHFSRARVFVDDLVSSSLL